MTRAKNYGFIPSITIEQGIKNTIQWYVKNKKLADAGKDVFKLMEIK